ncbi:tumor necrosis factor receptor superfamily member 1A [Pempheris klunzingeri]|uniref:tumor necrosis factor receptor superfamily member 1A n=1 Tax=Pempheris klunzingeri TaxID=3127111 RepID=UPI0039813A71
MEGGVHGGRWNKKAPAGTTLLLMCLFIPTMTLLQPSEEKTCPRGDYLTDEGICCNKCFPGFKLVEKCHATGQRSNCSICPDGQYTDQMNSSPNCRSCRRCKSKKKHEIQVSKCEKHRNTICRCEPGYYRSYIDSETYECLKCTPCGPDEKEKQKCTPETNTVCECTENYYRVNKKCEPCKNCSTECRHHCASLPTLNTRAPDTEKEHLVKIIAGVIAVALILLVLVVLITYMVTKRSTKKKLLRLTAQSSVSSGSCQEVLIHSEGPSNTISAKATPPPTPVSEQEQLSNLPDCVPLEIKTSGLIYTVLDLVPALQVKQLVRSLGVKDIEIEQAELDHRSCLEAHYQMLRVWIERGSHAGGGGRDGMLHRPLLQELLDELRKMHLGRAAEELETKYSIQ